MTNDGETIEPNTTLDGLLRKLEDGDTINIFGAEVQEYLAELRRSAKRKNGNVTGKVTIEITMPMNAEGYGRPVAKLTTKAIPKPQRPESTIYVDEDGDIQGKPVPRQTTIYEVKSSGKADDKNPAQPAAKGM